jgi:hypothetical protein
MSQSDQQISSRRRLSALLLALLASIATSYWAQHAESDTPEIAEAIVRNAPTVPAAPQDASSADVRLDLDRLARRQLVETDVDAFRTKNWYVAPSQTVSSPEPSTEPTTPPLPFQFIGKIEEVEGGKTVVYLVNNNELYAVSEGEKFAESYRLERVEHAVLVIRYLPLSIDQSLPIATNQ